MKQQQQKLKPQRRLQKPGQKHKHGPKQPLRPRAEGGRKRRGKKRD